MNFKFDDIQVFIYSYEKIWIILKEDKFIWYEYIFNIFLNQEFNSKINIILEIKSNIKNFILFNKKKIKLYKKVILIIIEINIEFKFINNK